MLADYHMHTALCQHAKGTPLDYLKKAQSLGLEEICFTDHAPAPCGYDPTNRMQLAQHTQYRDMIQDLISSRPSRSSPPTILFGTEADYYAGCQDFLTDWLPAQDFDLVLGSVHYIGDWGFDDPAQIDGWKNADITRTWQQYFQLLIQLAQTGLYDVVAHLDLPKKFGHRPPPADLSAMATPALDAIATASMAIDINTCGLRRPADEIYPSASILKMACQRNIPITFGSDAHDPDDVGSAFDQALILAREAGYTQCARFRKRNLQLVDLPQSF